MHERGQLQNKFKENVYNDILLDNPSVCPAMIIMIPKTFHLKMCCYVAFVALTTHFQVKSFWDHNYHSGAD